MVYYRNYRTCLQLSFLSTAQSTAHKDYPYHVKQIELRIFAVKKMMRDDEKCRKDKFLIN